MSQADSSEKSTPPLSSTIRSFDWNRSDFRESAKLNHYPQVLSTINYAGRTEEDTREMKSAAVGMLNQMSPQGPFESMLCAQIVAVHFAAMEAMRRASRATTLEVQERFLRQGTKLMSLFARQQEVLDRHRGKAPQQVSVGAVNVHAGAQAVVGNVQQTRVDAGEDVVNPKPEKQARGGTGLYVADAAV